MMEEVALLTYENHPCIQYVCIMQICDEELSQPSQQVPAAELLHIHILHIIMTMCPSRGWRTEDRVVGGGESNSWAATEAGPPSPSQGLFSTLCRYQVYIQYLHNEYAVVA